MADYPAAVTSFTTLVDDVTPITAGHHNDVADEVVAIQSTLGVNPQGASATVVARLNAISAMSNGTMLNGLISPTVVSNDLIVALKTFAGNDPSASDPVFVVIGGVVRSVTSALSVTCPDGTNWCNAGGAALATNEHDRFVYLGYNATDGVVIGHARFSHANLYSDFSATNTNEKFCAISNIAHAAAGDNYVNIGRFAATLSAGSGYTWTVPTFTASNLKQKPIFETRKLTWTGVITPQTGSATTVSSTCTYKLASDLLYVYIAVLVTNKGTASGAMFINAPFAASILSPISGYENLVTASSTSAKYDASTITAFKYDVSTLWNNGWAPNLSGNALI